MQRVLAIILAFCGVGLLMFAYQGATQIPELVEKDFGAYVRAAGGTLSSTPNFPDAFKQMHVERRLLQNGYIGGSGLVLLAAGAFGCVLQGKRREA
jgi:hypothetical protein